MRAAEGHQKLENKRQRQEEENEELREREQRKKRRRDNEREQKRQDSEQRRRDSEQRRQDSEQRRQDSEQKRQDNEREQLENERRDNERKRREPDYQDYERERQLEMTTPAERNAVAMSPIDIAVRTHARPLLDWLPRVYTMVRDTAWAVKTLLNSSKVTVPPLQRADPEARSLAELPRLSRAACGDAWAAHRGTMEDLVATAASLAKGKPYDVSKVLEAFSKLALTSGEALLGLELDAYLADASAPSRALPCSRSEISTLRRTFVTGRLALWADASLDCDQESVLARAITSTTLSHKADDSSIRQQILVEIADAQAQVDRDLEAYRRAIGASSNPVSVCVHLAEPADTSVASELRDLESLVARLATSTTRRK